MNDNLTSPVAKLQRVAQFARDDFGTYVRFLDRHYKMSKFHCYLTTKLEEAVRKFEGGESVRICLSVPPRHGKQFEHSTPILTTKGWKTHGELVVGDYVFHPSGKPIRVVALSPDSESNVRITFTNGESIKCHENHEWVVSHRSKWETVETKHFLEKGKSGERVKLDNDVVGRGHKYYYHLPLHEALQLPSRDLPIDPYTLGVWLGDGTSDSALICGSVTDMEHIVPRIKYTPSVYFIHKTTGVAYQRFVGGMRTALRVNNLLNNKHIPQDYFISSIEQRRALLAGLVDTDGSVDSSGRVRFVGCNERLVREVAELAETLGYSSHIQVRKTPIRDRAIRDVQTCFVATWTPHDGMGAGTLPRKSIPNYRDRQGVAIESVEYCEPSRGRCIQVDSEDGLYLVGKKLIATHNSRLSCIEMVTWLLGRNPALNVALVSYAETLCAEHLVSIRDRMSHPYYEMCFPDTEVRTGYDTKNAFKTTSGGGVKGAGIRGGITGMGFSVMILDDTLKNAQESRSKVIKDGIWAEYCNTAATRMTPVYMIICIGTRWSTDDLIGRLQDKEPEKWDFIDLPALCIDPETDPLHREYDGPLFPENYTQKRLMELRDLDPRMFSALYQGKPNIIGGNIVSRDDCTMITIDKVPATARRCRGFDLAVGTKTTNDFSSGALCAYDHMSKCFYILDVWKDKKPWNVVKAKIIEFGKRDSDGRRVAVENVSGFEIACVELDSALAGHATLQRINPRGRDKITRAQVWVSLAKAGRLFVVKGSWNSAFFDELEGFPNSSSDDQIDGVSIAFEALVNCSEQSRLAYSGV